MMLCHNNAALKKLLSNQKPLVTQGVMNDQVLSVGMEECFLYLDFSQNEAIVFFSLLFIVVLVSLSQGSLSEKRRKNHKAHYHKAHCHKAHYHKAHSLFLLW